MQSPFSSLGMNGDENVIQARWCNSASPQTSHDEPRFKLQSDVCSVAFLVDEEISLSLLDNLLGHDKFFSVVEVPRPAVQSLAVETVEIFLFVKSPVGPENNEFHTEFFRDFILLGRGGAIFYGKTGAHEEKRKIDRRDSTDQSERKKKMKNCLLGRV